MNGRRLLLTGASALALAAALPGTAPAFDITGAVTTPQTMGAGVNSVSGSIVVGDETAVFDHAAATTLAVSGSIRNASEDNATIVIDHDGLQITNSGTIANAVGEAIYSEGRLGTFVNSGTIAGGDDWAAINLRPGLDGDFVNTGTITGPVWVGGELSGLFLNTGEMGDTWLGNVLGEVTNEGTISSAAEWRDPAFSVRQVHTLTNTGAITSAHAGIYVDRLLGNLVNSGSITAAHEGIFVYDSQGTITNHGTIDAAAGIVGLHMVGGEIVNHGTIAASWAGMIGSGAVSNHGRIEVTGTAVPPEGRPIGIGVQSDTVFMTNTGEVEVSGENAIGLAAVESSEGFILNEGTVRASGAGSAGVFLHDARAMLLNFGTISASGPGAVAVDYSGSLDGSMILQGGLVEGDILLSTEGANSILVAGETRGDIVGTGADDVVILFGNSGNTIIIDTLGEPFETTLPGAILGGNITARLVAALDGEVRIDGNRSVAIQGDGFFVLTDSGTLAMAPDSSLQVDGNAILAGSIRILPTRWIADGETLAVFGATGDLNKDELAIVETGSLRFTDIGGSDGVELLAHRTPFAALAGGGSGHGFAGMLDRIGASGPIDPVVFDIIAALDQLSAGKIGDAVRQLEPVQPLGAIVAGGAVRAQATGAINQRTAALRDGSRGIATGDIPLDQAIWVQATGSRSERDGDASTDGHRARIGAVTLGGDAGIGENLRLGAALTYGRAWVSGTGARDGDRTDVDSYQLSVYGSYEAEAWHAEGLVGLGYNRHDQRRVVDLLGQTAEASYDAVALTTRLGGGYDLAVGRVLVTPNAALQYTRLWQEGYTETGANAMTIGAVTHDALEATLGVRARWQYQLAGMRLQPELRAAWVHDFLDDAIETRGSFAGIAFTTRSERPARDGARLGAGATLTLPAGLTMGLDYEAELRDGYTGHTGLVNVRMAF